jgi:hypothetical protein
MDKTTFIQALHQIDWEAIRKRSTTKTIEEIIASFHFDFPELELSDLQRLVQYIYDHLGCLSALSALLTDKWMNHFSRYLHFRLERECDSNQLSYLKNIHHTLFIQVPLALLK